MTACSELSIILSPLIGQFQPTSLLIVGETAFDSYQPLQDTRSQVLKTPFKLEQLTNITPIDLAIISDITDTLPKPQAIEWLGLLRNGHAPHIIVIAEMEQSTQQGWQLADFLALGMHRVGSANNYQIFSYAIESYRPKRDWLNSKFWANPENYGKYRW